MIPAPSNPLPPMAGMPERPAELPPRQDAADDDEDAGDRRERPAATERTAMHRHPSGTPA